MSEQHDPERIGTLIIGAGQSGLAAGYHLARRGLPFLIVDADERIGDHWRHHWDSLRLFSPAAVDGLPGMAFPARSAHFPTGREMGDYLEAYAERFALPVESGTIVERVRHVEGDRYEATAGSRRFVADQVIVASGAFRQPSIPAVAASLDPAIRQLHSSEYKHPGQLRDGPVLVVGLSHSGADIAVELAKTRTTYLSGKSAGELPIQVTDTPRARFGWLIVRFVATRVLTMATPMGRRMAPHVRSGGAPLLRVRRKDLERAGVIRHDAKTTGVSDGKPTLDDGTVVDVANVVWATGFRPDYGWVEVPGFVGDDGWPTGTRGVASAAPGLYFLGVPFQWAFASMNVFGVGRDAAYLIDRIAERVRASAAANDGSGSRSVSSVSALPTSYPGSSRSSGPT
ncbi:MAG TPA: NAD(P)-binding domain-containing protein [Candidatus Limnocylindrales bacterium]